MTAAAHLAVSAVVFALCAAAPPLLRAWRLRRWGLPVRLTVDPSDPAPADLCAYFAELARRLDERPERMILDLCGANDGGRRIALDFTPDGAMRAEVEGRRAKTFSLRNRWIPEHPVPLVLWPTGWRARVFRRGRLRLYIAPTDANRFRVMERPPRETPVALYLLCSALATVGAVCVLPVCLAAALGLALGSAAVR